MFTTNVKSSMHLSEELCYCGIIYFKLSYGIVTVLLLNSDELMPMDWFLYDNGLRHERVNILVDEMDRGLSHENKIFC